MNEQAKKIRALAANLAFDPDAYGDEGRGVRCKVCDAKHAPDRVCGYCRGAVKAMRAAVASEKKERKARAEEFRCRLYRDPSDILAEVA